MMSASTAPLRPSQPAPRAVDAYKSRGVSSATGAGCGADRGCAPFFARARGVLQWKCKHYIHSLAHKDAMAAHIPRLATTPETLLDALLTAAFRGDVDVIKALLADRRADPAALGSHARQAAPAGTGHVGVVRNPAEWHSAALVIAACKGHTGIVCALLADGRADPAATQCYALGRASFHGHVDIVRALLADGRVDPAASGCAALDLAAQNGHAEIVRVLLADRRADPAARDSSALHSAAQAGHTEIIHALLLDGRVDPASRNNAALRDAVASRRLGVVRALLADERVNAAVLVMASNARCWQCLAWHARWLRRRMWVRAGLDGPADVIRLYV
jgi:hypothetical protein